MSFEEQSFLSIQRDKKRDKGHNHMASSLPGALEHGNVPVPWGARLCSAALPGLLHWASRSDCEFQEKINTPLTKEEVEFFFLHLHYLG